MRRIYTLLISLMISSSLLFAQTDTTKKSWDDINEFDDRIFGIGLGIGGAGLALPLTLEYYPIPKMSIDVGAGPMFLGMVGFGGLTYHQNRNGLDVWSPYGSTKFIYFYDGWRMRPAYYLYIPLGLEHVNRRNNTFSVEFGALLYDMMIKEERLDIEKVSVWGGIRWAFNVRKKK